MKELNKLGIQTDTLPISIAKWNCEFQINEHFLRPNMFVRLGKRQKPHIFELSSLVEARVIAFISAHLYFFTI